MSKSKIMGKLQILAKKYLDKDIKTLVKHKYLDNTLAVTDEGLEFLASFLYSHFKAELADEARKQSKDKQEEEDCDDCDGCDNCEVDKKGKKKK